MRFLNKNNKYVQIFITFSQFSHQHSEKYFLKMHPGTEKIEPIFTVWAFSFLFLFIPTNIFFMARKAHIV